jgi:hypothetical protein
MIRQTTTLMIVIRQMDASASKGIAFQLAFVANRLKLEPDRPGVGISTRDVPTEADVRKPQKAPK